MKKTLVIALTCLILSACYCSDADDNISILQEQIERLELELDEAKRTELPISGSPPKSLHKTDIEWHEFFTSDQYWQLHATAFQFLRAFYYADIDAAKKLAADPNNDEWLAWIAPVFDAPTLFPTGKRSLDNISGYFVSVNRFTGTVDYYEKDGEQIRIIHLYVNVSDEEIEKNYLIHLYTIYVDGRWKITDFALDS